MRRIYVIGRNWEEIDTWIRSANDRYRSSELVPVPKEQVLDRMQGVRAPHVIDLVGLENFEREYRWLLNREAVWIAS